MYLQAVRCTRMQAPAAEKWCLLLVLLISHDSASNASDTQPQMPFRGSFKPDAIMSGKHAMAVELGDTSEPY